MAGAHPRVRPGIPPDFATAAGSVRSTSCRGFQYRART